ncbi:nuclear nucleic acid-binding protein C1D [Diabrotica undecimpunctata]|uniref:nuclear nucleic acid-binding protein C1D n=1 Tax=Diabrotica undecimpunctata TaxID=50387 RepID=UPI003B634C27
MEFGDLKNDIIIQEKLTNFHNSVEKIELMLEKLNSADIYEQLSVSEKVDYDLFVAYTLNTLYWLYLRTQNEDPNKNEVKSQLNRIKEYMVKAKQARERHTIRPKVDKFAAERFIKHGINYSRNEDNTPTLNKRIRFED